MIQKQYERKEPASYEKLTIDQLIQFFENVSYSAVAVEELPLDLLKKMADKDPTLLDVWAFKHRVFQEDPSYIESLSPENQKNVIKDFVKHDLEIAKILIARASDEVQLSLAKKGHALRDSISEINSLKIVAEALTGNELDEFLSLKEKKSKIYEQLMNLSDEEFFLDPQDNDWRPGDKAEELYEELTELHNDPETDFAFEMPIDLLWRMRNMFSADDFKQFPDKIQEGFLAKSDTKELFNFYYEPANESVQRQFLEKAKQF